MIGVTVTDKGTVQKLDALARQLKNPVGLAKVLGREASNRLKAHFREKQKTPNRLGGQRQNFWRQVMQSVNQPTVSEDGALVTIRISDPRFAQKLYGGVITPKKAKALAIPVTADAYGRAPKVLEQEEGIKLFVLSLSGQGPGTGYLATKAADGGVKVHYVLRGAVDQEADPTALPNQAEFNAALVARAESYVDRITKGEQGLQS